MDSPFGDTWIAAWTAFPLMPHSLTKLRIKINLNTLEIKLVLNHKPIALESFQKAWRYKHTFHSENPGETPDVAWGSEDTALFWKVPPRLTIRHSAVKMTVIMSLCGALKLNPSEQSCEINSFISVWQMEEKMNIQDRRCVQNPTSEALVKTKPWTQVFFFFFLKFIIFF